MPLRTPTTASPTSRSSVSRWRTGIALAAALLVVAFAGWNYVQPLPDVGAASTVLDRYVITGTPPTLPWPSVGSAAVGVSDLGLIAASGDPTPTPAASIAKVMTALIVLADKPLARDESGPILTISAQDVATYGTDAADEQSVVPVTEGEKLSEFQALEAMLVASGNNIAETLARWDAGAVPAFVTKMNQRAASLHMTQTTFAEPAGASTQTVSTPVDLMTLGMAAMQQDVLAEIVSLPDTTLPVAGRVYNVNGALGQKGIVGIKTGFGLNTGADFLFAAATVVDGRQLTLYGSVMGQPTLDIALSVAEALIGAMQPALKARALVSPDDVVGEYDTAWGSHSNLVATKGVTFVEWPGAILHMRIDAIHVPSGDLPAAGSPAGSLHVTLGDQSADVPLITAGSLSSPSLTWRLLRIHF